MTNPTETAATITANLFHEWSHGELGLNKWDVYPVVFGLMDARKITLAEIIELAATHCDIRPDVIRMRRRDHLAYTR